MTKRKLSFLRILITSLLAIFLLATLTRTRAGQDLVKLVSQKFAGQPTAETGTITGEEVIEQINNFRVGKSLNSLHRSEKLDKAALSRLTVVETSEDYSGDLTGVTLENAVKNNGYSYSVIGELQAIGVLPGIDLTNFWADDASADELLSEKNLTDIGIALNQEGSSWDIIVILARPIAAVTAPRPPRITWGGVELWQAVNKRRVEMGVNPLSQRDELCTIASIRLNQLLDLGKLDGHAGLEPTLNRDDLKWIKEKYNLAEFLVVGYPTPEETVKAWENTLGHRDLLAGGQYVWGCVYSQNSFGVAIAAY